MWESFPIDTLIIRVRRQVDGAGASGAAIEVVDFRLARLVVIVPDVDVVGIKFGEERSALRTHSVLQAASLNPDASPRGGLTRAPRLGGSGSERLGGHESLDTSPAQIYATSN